jgi:hypothetical protein
MKALQKRDDGKMILGTPLDPRSGATSIALAGKLPDGPGIHARLRRLATNLKE